MPIKKDSDRQYVLSAWVPFTHTDLAAGANVAVELPGNAIVVGGDLVVTTAGTGTSTITIAVGDGGVANRYLAAQDVKTAAGRWALVPTGYTYPATDTVDLTLALGGTFTGIAGHVRVDYIVKGRGNENQGD